MPMSSLSLYCLGCPSCAHGVRVWESGCGSCLAQEKTTQCKVAPSSLGNGATLVVSPWVAACWNARKSSSSSFLPSRTSLACERKRVCFTDTRVYSLYPRSVAPADLPAGLIHTQSHGRCSPSSHPAVSWRNKGRVRRAYRGTSLIRTTPPVGPYGSPMPRDLW